MSFFDDIFGAPNPQTTFKLYTNESLQNETDANPNAESAIEFTALDSFTQQCDSNVAYESLEDGLFSSDSRQLSPKNVNISCFYSPVMTTSIKTKQDKVKQIQYVIELLDNYYKGTDLLTIIQDDTVFINHPNMVLVSYSFTQNMDNPILYVNLVLQEVRMQDSEYTSMSVNNVTNPQSSNTVANNTSPKQPNTTTMNNLGV